MADLILFHYPLSPFSEKTRVMLGYAGLKWQSVSVPEMPPRPVLEELTGGYRKIPVAQLGADIFCDTRTIAREIAELSNRPKLALENNPEEVRAFVAEADLELFMACIIASSSPRLLFKMASSTSMMHTVRFLKDRINVAKTARLKPMKTKVARERVKSHIARLESMLEQDYLFGDEPCIADFSAYHGLWYVRDLAEKKWTREYPRVEGWMNRMKAFGQGTSVEISGEDALGQARQAEPRALGDDASHELIGEHVRIAPDDYARDPVTGILVGADDHEWVLRREPSNLGTVHVHFPREGFAIKKV